MVLGIALPYCLVHKSLKSVLINGRGWVGQFFGQDVHQALHKVTLTHQQVFSDAAAVSLKLVLHF